METEHPYDFTATRKALESLQRLLFCCQCERLTRNVCTFGNCEHFFCKQCVEDQLGSRCPVCETPAHARDAQVNKQLSNIVSVSQELARLLHSPLGGSDSAEGEDQDEGESNIATIAARGNASEQDTVSTPGNSIPNHQDTTTAEDKSCATYPDGCQNSPDHFPHKGAKRNKRKTPQTTPTQIRDEQPTDEEKSGGKDAQARNKTREKVQTPQTRMRNKQNPSSDQKTTRKRVTRRSDPVKNAEEETSVSGSEDGNDLTADNDTVNQQSSPLPTAVAAGKSKRKGRQTLISLTVEKVQETANASSESLKTPPPSRSGRRRSKSPRVSDNSTTPSPVRVDDDDDAAATTTNTSYSSSSRRRSAPVTPNQKRRQTEEAGSQRRRRSMPLSLTPSSSAKTGVSPHGDTNRGSSKLSLKKTSDGVATKVKRNAKGETTLHVAAIKGDITAVRELLSRGNNPNVRDNAGWTPLHEAVNHGHTAVAEILLQRGAMLNMPGMDNDTPLHDAVANHRLDCVRLLVTYGASVTARNIHGKTALELAMTDGMREALLQQPSSAQPPDISSLPQVILDSGGFRRSRPEDTEEFRPLCFLGTALSRDQRGMLQKCATKLHAKVVEDYCSEVTHVVSSVNGDGQCPRTLKYLHGVLGGKWVVSIEWVSICLEYGQKVSEEAFEVPGSSTHPHSSAANKARVNRKLQLPGLFDGCQVYLHGSFSRLPPSKAELTNLLHLGGARLLTREPRLANLDEYEVTIPYHASPGSSIADCGIFIVHDGGSKAPTLQAQRIRAVPASWVIECIATFSLPEPDSTSS